MRLVVHDWGAVGLLWAQRFPERVERLVVINAVPLLPGYRWHRARADVAHARRRRGRHRALHRAGPGGGCSRRPVADESWPHFDQGTQRAILQLYRSSPEDALARAGAATSGASTARRSSCGAIATRTSPRPSPTPTRGRSAATAEVLHLPERRALALARPAGCRRSHRRVPGRLAPGAIPAWALAAVVAAAVYLVLAPPSADLAGAGVPRRPRPRAVGQRLVRRPSHARLQRALPAAGRAARPAARRRAQRGRGRVRSSSASCATATARACAARCGSPLATATTPHHRAADLRAGRRLGLAAVLAAARGRTRLGVRPGGRSRASPARWPAPSSRWRRAAWWLDRRRWWPVALAALRAGARRWRSPSPSPRAAASRSSARASGPALAAAIARRARRARATRACAHRRRALRAWRMVASFVARRRRWAATSCASARSSPDRCSRRSLWRTRPPRARPAGAAAPVLAVGRAGRRLGPRRRRRVGARALLRRRCSASWRARGGGPFRVEIPFTDNHWESRWVAPHVPLARGWERQLDRERNALFYDGRPLTPARYRALARRQRGALRRAGRRADSTTRRRARPSSCATACRTCARSGATRTGACSRSPARGRWRAAPAA